MGRSPRKLGGLAVAVFALAAPASALAGTGFTNGVTAGDVSDSSAIVWGQTTKDGKITAEVATDKRFKHDVFTKSLKAKGSTDDTVQTTVKGLKPGKTYHYRFCTKKGCGDKGQFQTAPKPSQKKTIRFAYSGDETGVAAMGQSEPFWGDFKAFKSMAAENNDFNIDFGDTIYSDPEVPDVAHGADREAEVGRCTGKKLAVKNMRTIRESTGLYNHWDDHEFINDFSIPENGTQALQGRA